MPIYAYKCESCGLAKDVLQKMSDDPLNDCPACGKATFKKQLTAAGFQLKGSGWYATDFKGGGTPAPATEDKSDGASDGKSEGQSDAKAETKSETKTDSKSDAKTETSAPASSPAPVKSEAAPAPKTP